MDKKLLLAMAIPAVLVGCSQDEFVSENGNNAVAAGGKAISGVTFSIEKSGLDADTRATWSDANRIITFDKDDNISLF